MKIGIQRITNVLSALALIGIATNMTVSNVRSNKPAIEPAKPQESVVKVVGRVDRSFDGLGFDTGFLVDDGSGKFQIVGFDTGSMMGNRGFKPDYLTVMRWTNGKTSVSPITVSPLN